MPRRAKQEVVLPTTSLVASATRYQGEVARIYRPNQPWQTECYRHYTICGEARFAARFFGHAMGRAMLGVAKRKNGTKETQTSGEAYDLLEDLFNGKDGQAQMLESIGLHLTIAGECYLVGRTERVEGEQDIDGDEIWEIVSPLEMKVTGTTWKIDYGVGTKQIELTDDDVVIRIWLPSPERRIEADSPFRALLPILSEIEWLTKMIFGMATSRLTGNGILFIPNGMTFPPPPQVDGQPQETANDADAFMRMLADMMLTPLNDPSNPAARVPGVAMGPGEEIDKIKWQTFWSEFDGQAKDLRAEAITRFAIGMDLPPEQVLGMASNGGTGGGTSNGVSHWGAWQIEEATIKMHVEPMLELVVNALTMGYIRPLTEDLADVVVYDTANLRLRPDRSKEAMELHDRGKFSDAAMLREIGFDVSDLPDEKEYQQWLLHKVASGSATPEMVNAALQQLGIDLGVTAPDETPREARPDPSLEEHPTRPRTPSESALVAASEALVFRALERAGNRMRNKGAQPPGVPAYQTHCWVSANGDIDYLMSDAWSCAEPVLAGVADFEKVIPVLDSYCRTLITEQKAHDRERLRQWLGLAEVGAS